MLARLQRRGLRRISESKFHSNAPLSMSKPMMTPEGSSVDALSVTLAPAISTWRVTSGGEVGLRVPGMTRPLILLQVDDAVLAEERCTGRPVSALIATMVASAVGA
jgi:hypothetical protein